jgi:GTP-binding protein
MKITSAKFMRGIVGENEILEDGIPQIAFIGRSNAGKSSLLNSLTGVKKLAVTSNTPGRTKEINVFLINNSHYFMDLPGYGFARASAGTREALSELIFWYLLDSNHNPKVVLLVDANVGPTVDDVGMLKELENAGREIVVVLNKVDKIKKSQYTNQIKKLSEQFVGHKLFPYSSVSKIGIEELSNEIFST